MIRSYIVTAIRNLWKYRFYSLINILGLAIGLTCFLFILLYVQDELTYDKYHKNADRIYRINFEGFAFEQELDFTTVGAQVGPTILREYPEVEQIFRFRQYGGNIVAYENKSFREPDWVYADSTFFDVFSFNLVKGDPKQALVEPNTLVITEEVAKKYFGNDDPIGKSVRVDNNTNYRITGVMEAMPRNTHFNFDFLASLSSREESRDPTWLNNNFHTYVVLKEGVNPEAVNEKFDALIRTYIGPEIEQFMGKTIDDLLASGSYLNFSLFPLTKIHLYSDKQNELGTNGDINYVYIFSFIGLFILLLACVNFINLSTARSATRAKEVGMRKVVGARRPQLIAQFLSESFLVAILALIIAGSLLFVLLPYFNDLSGKQFVMNEVISPNLLLLMLSLVGVVGLVAGSYPALHLSSFKPLFALKNSAIKQVGHRISLRSVLVIFQFAITIGLIVGTIVVSDQITYIQNKKLGYDKDHVIILDNFYTLGNNCLPFKEEVAKFPEVISVTMTGALPTPSNRNSSATFLGREADPSKTHVLQQFTVDVDYIPTLGMEIVQGRAFSTEFPSDSSAVILNEAAVALYGLDDPLGVEVSNFSGGTAQNPVINTRRVIGVVKNFHFESLRNKIGPLALFMGNSSSNLAMKINTSNVPAFISRVKELWNQMGPSQPFDYAFMEDDFNAIHEEEARVKDVFSVFTIIAIIIACLGLFGLATFTTEQRTREMGIRKVIGASISRIFFLLTTEIVKWVLIANLIALPIAYFLMKKWLEGFAYPIPLSLTIFIGALLIGVLIAVITVSYQAIRVSIISPSRALRHE